AARNPGERGHTAGGSAAGSGGAGGGGVGAVAVGSEAGGLGVRAGGLWGGGRFQGTHGLVPVGGVIPLAWSLDHVGVLVRSVADAALAMSVLAGRDLSPSSVSSPRLALAPELLGRASREVADHIEAVADAFARAGATVSKIELPSSF